MIFEFTTPEEGTIYLIPNFIRCIHCNHEIPISELLNLQVAPNAPIIDFGSCGKKSTLADYAKYFGVIKNVR